MMIYYDYRDRLMRHKSYHTVHFNEIKGYLTSIYKYIEDNFHNDCNRIIIQPLCIKTRTDDPLNVDKHIHIKKAGQLLNSTDNYVKAVDRDTSMHDLSYFKDIVSAGEYKHLAKQKPLRFMVYESYIMGGTGTYLVGEVLSGVMRGDTVLAATPQGLEAEIGVLEKERKVIEQAEPFDRVGVVVPNLKCMQLPRGTMLSEPSHRPAQSLDFAYGFFLTINFKGELKTGSKLYMVSNRITRKCKIEIESVIRMDSTVLIEKSTADSIKSNSIVFIKVLPLDPLVLDDPIEFPEFAMTQLWDSCQVVAIGKIFKLFHKQNKQTV